MGDSQVEMVVVEVNGTKPLKDAEVRNGMGVGVRI